MDNRLMAARQRVFDSDSLAKQRERIDSVIEQVRGAMLAPTSAKSQPRFNISQLSHFTGLDATQIDNRIRRPGSGVATGTKVATRRYFSVEDVQQWRRQLFPDARRPAGADGVVLTCANLKGGVTKSTTTVCVAQALSLRGHRGLIIDLDPQGTLTTFMGMSPETEVSVKDTLFALFRGLESSVEYAIKKTYWPNLDLVPANASLEGANMILSARQRNKEGFEFWNELNNGLEAARGEYDFIIIDTPPALSMTSINGMMAADGLIMPLPPKAIDFFATSQFWDLFEEVIEYCKAKGAPPKKFSFVDVVLSMVDSQDAATDAVREWIVAAYGEKVLPVEIPKTNAAATASKSFGSIYDLIMPGTTTERSSTSTATFKRAFDAYERLGSIVEGQVVDFWALQLAGSHA